MFVVANISKQANGPHYASNAQHLDVGLLLLREDSLGNSRKPTVDTLKISVGTLSQVTPATLHKLSKDLGNFFLDFDHH